MLLMPALTASPAATTTAKLCCADDESRWQAVLRRDKQADGQFFYAVRTTGVVCRPSCASRQARRENVSFYDTLDAAEQAGYRPCRRCRPQQATMAVRHAQAISAACHAIAAAETLPALEQLAQQAGMSRFHFHRLFKQHIGVTPREYAAAIRARRLRDGLEQGGSITAAMFDAGFNSSGRFYAQASTLLGMTPTAYRDGGDGAEIRFAVAQCWLGAVLVAATAQGVCAVTLGDEPEQLVRTLQDRFPQAELVGADAAFEQLVAQVLGAIEAPGSSLDLPLDIRGTAFQQRVWQALRKIAPGQRVSYAQLAQRIGQPAAVRAVASACAANEIAVLIPCHRVVRTDGSLSGYRWGVVRKQALLVREQES